MTTTIQFSLVIAFVAVFSALVYARGVSDTNLAKHWVGAFGFVLGWLGLQAGVVFSGLLETEILPPPGLLYLVVLFGFGFWFCFSRFGDSLANAPFAWLVGFQAFRIPLELILHAMYGEGVLPIQMTFEGLNFDIVSGFLALILFVALQLKPDVPRWAIWLVNIVGSLLLLTVIIIAVLSSPFPIRQFLNDPPVVLVFFIPYTWIVSVAVLFAFVFHVITFRKLFRAEEL